eukprot:10960110-Lingulodinium_polyedra.AAC.1
MRSDVNLVVAMPRIFAICALRASTTQCARPMRRPPCGGRRVECARCEMCGAAAMECMSERIFEQFARECCSE